MRLTPRPPTRSRPRHDRLTRLDHCFVWTLQAATMMSLPGLR